jgi:formylglycine-generating enzyme required for sulfatase activity
MHMFRHFVLAAVFFFTVMIPAHAQDTNYPPQGQQIPGPACYFVPAWNTPLARLCDSSEIDTWRADITRWRDEERARMGFDDAAYRTNALRWTQSSFIQPQMMVHDRYFYDPVSRRYTVDRYLDDVEKRYGGIDSVLVWHTYPNLGIDDRNQYDLFRDLPGGTEGVRQMVADFHRRGVRVLFPVMMWDRGTRAEGVSDEEAIARELAVVGADGINGDTLEGIPQAFAQAAEQAGHPLALEPELGVASDEMLAWNTMSWGEEWKSTFVPMLPRYKWLEPRHMVNLVDRWAHDRNDDLQIAFLHGIGYISWENIWGIWNGITPRDAETLRRVAAIDHAFAPLLVSPQWEPLTQTLHFGVFADKWPGDRATLWTLVNRNPYPVDGRQISVPARAGARYYDLWTGSELTPSSEKNQNVLSFSLDANGYGAVLETAAPLSAAAAQLLEAMRQRPQWSTLSGAWKALPQTLVAVPKTKPATKAAAGMIFIPAAEYDFRVHGIEIEGQNDEGVDVQYPWEMSPRRYHQHTMHIAAFYIDRFPVTNAEYKHFLDATHYHPADGHNFLRDWKNGSFPEGWANKPVTWVSREDAGAYAAWAGKRLPHEWEWQYAAQGMDSRGYPWGSSPQPAAVPAPDTGRTMQPAAEVDAHPAGASAFGVMDMTGNVWQWTDEYQDDHTRAAILRGGSHYQPQGARWYFPQAYRLDEHGKYLLMAPGMDRSGAIGFRCVQDVP